MSRAVCVIGGLTGGIYVAALVLGLHTHDLSLFRHDTDPAVTMAWSPPARSTIPSGLVGDNIRLGREIFSDTSLYAPEHTAARVSCADCHAAGGIQPFASPMVGLTQLFPMYNKRAGHVISLKDRIQECMVRSENGTPLDDRGQEMTALVSYIGWLSQPHKNQRPYVGRGLISLPVLRPDPIRGESIYQSQCAGCHGDHGQGIAPLFPALWGPSAFNDGAGMNGISKMAAFVQHNMPQNRMGILSPQQAYDVTGFIHQMPRPAFNKAYARY
jgi:thiosulfate dehydrogenase